jgi:HAD superfamily hydrolase (TIGR01509 family)
MTSISAGRELDTILRRVRVVLLDFDGPVCAVFAGVGDTPVADHLRASLNAAGYPTNGADGLGPHGVLAYAATLDQAAAHIVEAELAAAELDAIKTAAPTPGADAFLTACADTGRPVVLASNNNTEAIAVYLDQHQLRQLVAHIEGRDPEDARRMKPNPWVIRRALAHVAASPNNAVLIGDALTDIEAAHAADVRVVGYANKPGKAARLQGAGADAIATDMHQVADALRTTGAPV